MPSMFMIDLLGTEISEEEKTILRHPNVGSVILFTHNFVNPEQLNALTAAIRVIRPDIFIAVDHEGGVVQRFQRHGFRVLPAARVYGDVFDINPETGIELARHYGEVMTSDVMEQGIDLSLAPILDVHGVNEVIGKLDRAFHHDPDVIIQLAGAFIQGMNKAGMPAIGKHFPGHGFVHSDSHIAMPVSDEPAERLMNVELKPFIGLMAQNLLAAVMPAHVTYTAIDPENPAGFSSKWLKDILRNELHFQGLVLSDCLSMAGACIGDMNARVNKAFEAGCDMIILCNQTRSFLLEILQTVTFKPSEESVNRIETFKKRMKRFAC